MTRPAMSAAPSVESLLQANERFYRVFESLNFDAMAALWEKSDRLYCVHPGWPALYGERPVLDSWKRIIGNTTAMSFNLTGSQALIDGNTGVVTVFEGIHSTVGRERHSSGAVSTNIFAFDAQAGLWKLFHHHASHTIIPEDEGEGTLLV